MNQVETRTLAVRLLCDLRGMNMEELASDEVLFVMEHLDKAYAQGWRDGALHGVGSTSQGPPCETCTDGGHEHG